MYKPHRERRAIAEYICCFNKMALVLKLEKLISVLIFELARLMLRSEVFNRSKIWLRLRTFF